ncbi:Cys-rich peptide radical SAM maturase CcpM [Enterocloster clostridioformis]|nr:Cys-rich peptide radical SAM maturase CcpM [Enterocloster clostridioformis]
MIVFKTIKTPKGCYVYDRNTNKILKVTQLEYDQLLEVEQGNRSFDDFIHKDKFQSRGYLKENIVEKIEHPELDLLEHYVNHRVHQLVLQVTQNCNLRCDYCVYSGSYTNRKHSNRVMSFHTAKKAMDYLILHSDELDEIVIGFYGGEPLLNLDLIKKCVTYMSDHAEGIKVSYSITTNGTLLTPEIAQYLSENKFRIMISLDGSRKEHDANRKFANGKGSFDTIMTNLKEIKRSDPEFIHKISFNTVINPKNDYNNVVNYFDNDEIMCEADVALNIVETLHSKKDIIFTEEFYAARSFSYLLFLLGLIGKIDSSKVSRTMGKQKVVIDDFYKGLANTVTIGKICHHSGPCVPGSRRLFITVDGEFYPCERVSENSCSMNIGNLEMGIDMEKAKRIMNIGVLTQNKCIKCWALPNCSMCATNADLDGGFSAEEKVKFCPGAKLEVLQSLKEICSLKEFGYDFGKGNISK